MLYVQVITRRARPTREFFCHVTPCRLPPGRAALFSPKPIPPPATNNLHFFMKVFLAVSPDLRYTVVVFRSKGSGMADVSVERI